MKEIKNKVQNLFEEIFKLMTHASLNNKLKECLELAQNNMCKQTSELEECMEVREAISEGMQKQKFALKEIVKKNSKRSSMQIMQERYCKIKKHDKERNRKESELECREEQ